MPLSVVGRLCCNSFETSTYQSSVINDVNVVFAYWYDTLYFLRVVCSDRAWAVDTAPSFINLDAYISCVESHQALRWPLELKASQFSWILLRLSWSYRSRVERSDYHTMFRKFKGRSKNKNSDSGLAKVLQQLDQHTADSAKEDLLTHEKLKKTILSRKKGDKTEAEQAIKGKYLLYQVAKSWHSLVIHCNLPSPSICPEIQCSCLQYNKSPKDSIKWCYWKSLIFLFLKQTSTIRASRALFPKRPRPLEAADDRLMLILQRLK